MLATDSINRAATNDGRGFIDLALGLAVATTLLASFVAAPRPVRTVGLMASTAIAATQWRSTADPRRRVTDEIAALARRSQVRAAELELANESSIHEARLALARDNAVLRQIAEAPIALQPVLLERAGFGWLVAAMQQAGPVTRPIADRNPAPNLPYTKDLAADDERRFAWVDTVLNAPAVLVFGPQGSGKTTLAEYLVAKRIDADHDIEVLDPHLKYGAWAGVKTFGAGMKYRELDDRLIAFEQLTKDRYEQFSSDPKFNPRPVTVVAEEFTNWASRCENAAEFFQASLTDNRKVKAHCLYISHGRTLAALGGAKGMSAARDRGLLEVELFAETGPDGRPRPTGRGKIRYPGETTWAEVAVPDLS